MRENFLFYLLAILIILITGIYAGIIYKRNHQTYNLLTLIANIVLFLVIILAYFTQWHFLNIFGNVQNRIVVLIIVCTFILFLLFNREIIQYTKKILGKYHKKVDK